MLPAIFGLQGKLLTPNEFAFFRAADPAGYILFTRNIESPRQLRSLTDSLRSLCGRDNLAILIDQEGGRVTRMGPPHWRSWPSAASFLEASADLEQAIYRVECNYEALGLELASMGLTVNCAPVLDIPVQGAHGIIGDRAFSDSADSVALLGRACLRGLRLAGLEGVIKHIPGHGRATSDSHQSTPKVAASASKLYIDSMPFRALSDASIAMTAHVIFDAWDPNYCASVSTKVIKSQIRGQLGFDGLLISDDIDMKALSGKISDRAVAVLAAGCDIALNCWGNLKDMEGIANAIPTIDKKASQRLAIATRHLRSIQENPALRERIELLKLHRDLGQTPKKFQRATVLPGLT